MEGEEGGKRKKPHSDRKWTLLPHGLVNVILYPLDQYILYLAFKSFTPYHSICSWWHQETYPRLPKRRKFTNFGDLWCICQSSQQSQNQPEDQERPQTLKNFLRCYKSLCRSSFDSQSLNSENSQLTHPCPVLENCRLSKPLRPIDYFRSFPNFQKLPLPCIYPVLEVSLIQTPATNRIIDLQNTSEDLPQYQENVLPSLLQPPVSSSTDSQSIISEDSPIYLPLCDECR